MYPQQILQTLISQWPLFSALCVIGLILFKQSEKQYERLLKQYSGMLEGNRLLLEERRRISSDHAEEVSRLRTRIEASDKERVAAFDNYQDLREQLGQLKIENISLKRLLVKLEEMARATGGDIKVIVKTIEQNSEDIKNISDSILALPSPRRD